MADQPKFSGEAGQSSSGWDYKSYAQSSSPYHFDLSKDDEPQKAASDENIATNSDEEKTSDNFQSTPQPTPPVSGPTFLGQFISRLWNHEDALKLRAAGTAAAKTVLGEELGEALAETVGSAIESAMFFDADSAPSLGDLYAHQVKYSSVVFLPDAEQDNRIRAYAYYNPLEPYFSGLTSEYPNADSLLFTNLEPSYLAQSGDAPEEASENIVTEETITPQESVAVADTAYSYTYDDVSESVSFTSTPESFATTSGVQSEISVSALDYDLLTVAATEVQNADTTLFTMADDSAEVVSNATSSVASEESQSAVMLVAEELAESIVEEEPSVEEEVSTKPPLESSLESAEDQSFFSWAGDSQAQQGFSQESESNSSCAGTDFLAHLEILTASSESGVSVEDGPSPESTEANDGINSPQAYVASAELSEGFIKKSRRGRDHLSDRDEDFKNITASLGSDVSHDQLQSAVDSGHSFATRDNARFINASVLMGARRPAERSEADLSLDEATLVRTLDHRLSTVSSSDHADSGHGDSQQKPDWSLLAQDSGVLGGEARSESKSPLYAEDLEDLPNPLIITDSVIV